MVPNAFLVTQFGWRPVLFTYGMVVMVGVFLMGLVARDRPEHLGLLPDGDPPKEPAVAGGARGRRASGPATAELGMRAGEILLSRDFWVLTLFLGATSIGNSAFSVHQLPYFESVGFSPSAAATTVALVGLISGVGRMGGGALTDFLDYRVVLVMIALLMSFSYFYLAVVPISSLATALPFVATFGVSFGSAIPVRPLVGTMLFGTRSLGIVIGLLQAGTVAAGAVGPVLMGYIFDHTGSYERALWVLGFLPLVPIPLLLLMKSRSTMRQWTLR